MDGSLSGVQPELARAIERWSESSDVDLNDFLDEHRLTHPPFKRHATKNFDDIQPEVVGGCDDGWHGAWVKAKDGHWWSTCVPNNG